MEQKEKEALNDLLVRLIDSRDGYKEAGAEASQPRHEKLFGDLANQRHEFGETVRKGLVGHGFEIDVDGTFEAGVHRFFMNLKHKLDKDNDEELLEEIVRGESDLIEKYEEAIKTLKTDTDLLRDIQAQYNQVKSNFEVIKAKEEAA
jgi:uncharacterized protein (TIGR02284 family)